MKPGRQQRIGRLLSLRNDDQIELRERSTQSAEERIVLLIGARGETEANWGYDFTLLRRALPVGVVYQMPVVVA